MGTTAIFAVMAVVLVAVATLHPQAAERRMFRIGSYFLAAAFAVVAISVLLTT